MGPRPLTGGRVRRVSTWSAAGSARGARGERAGTPVPGRTTTSQSTCAPCGGSKRDPPSERAQCRPRGARHPGGAVRLTRARDLVTLLAAPGAALPPAAPTATLADLLPAGVEPLPVAGPMPEPPPRRFEVVHGRLPRPRTTALLERCRQEGTTLHPALCVAWVRALAQTGGLVTGALPPAVSIPVDVRRLLPPDRQEAVGLLITTLVTPVDLGTDFWVAARAVSQDLAHRLTPDLLRERVRHSTEEFRATGTAPEAGRGGGSAWEAVRPARTSPVRCRTRSRSRSGVSRRARSCETARAATQKSVPRSTGVTRVVISNPMAS